MMTWSCPVQGRGLGARLRGNNFERMVIVANSPPMPKASGTSAYVSTVTKVSRWIDEMLMENRSCCTPVLCTDLNYGVGITKTGRAWEIDERTSAPGRCKNEKTC